MSGLRDAIRALSAPVAADFFEADDAYVLVFDLPGATPEGTTVTTGGGLLRIDATREKAVPPDARIIREERPRTIKAEIPLPADVRDNGASAALSDGVLEVTLPRGKSDTHIPIEDA